MRRSQPFITASITLAVYGAAAAHPILISSGAVEAAPDGLTLRLAISSHDLEHAGLDPDNPASADTFARDLASLLGIFDESGARLSLIDHDAVAPGAASTDAWQAVLRFQSPRHVDGAHCSYITFLQRRSESPGRTDPAVPAQPRPPRLVQLTVPGVESTDTIRLSDAGNPETVPVLLVAATSAASTPTVCDPESLRVPTLRLTPHSGAGASITVEIPAHLLRTWIDLPRADPDVLTADEAASYAAIAANWAEVQVQPAGIARAEPAAVRWLRPSDPHAGPAVPHPKLGFWSARIMIPLRLSAPNADNSLPRWTGFNNSVRVVRFDSSGHQPRIRYLVQRAEGVELPLR